MNNFPKIILFDIDGVLLNLPYYFSHVLLERGYKEAHNVCERFYTSDEHEQTLLGKLDIKKAIEPHLREFNWEGTCDDYFNDLFEFESNFFDQEMLSLVKRIKDSGVECFLCTDKNKPRFDFIINHPSIKNIFEEGFISCDIGFLKAQEGFWKYVLDDLKNRYPDIKPEEVAFFDDKQANIDTSLKFGFNSFLFTNIEKFKKDLNLEAF